MSRQQAKHAALDYLDATGSLWCRQHQTDWWNCFRQHPGTHFGKGMAKGREIVERTKITAQQHYERLQLTLQLCPDEPSGPARLRRFALFIKKMLTATRAWFKLCVL